MSRIKQIEEPVAKVSYDQWEVVIKTNFPQLLIPAKIGMALLAQFLINDITNAVAVVLIGPPASGKTISTNMFSGIKDFTYTSDNFTSKAFVSGAANVSREKLADVDLLPKIRHKLFIVRDLASLFSSSDEHLIEVLGRLTRILDGEGYSIDTGTHGQRGYQGDYLFFMLAATTPIQPRVWKSMGNLGPRMLFYRLKALPKTKKELVMQRGNHKHKVKEIACNTTTEGLIQTLWYKHQNGIDWNSDADPYEIRELIVTFAILLTKLRASIIKNKENEDDEGNISIESPDRAAAWLDNLARGHAVMQGRYQLEEKDLPIVLELAIDSGYTLRSIVFRALIKKGGNVTTNELIEITKKSQTSVLRTMKELVRLDVCVIKPALNDTAGRPQDALSLAEDFRWFGTETCREMLFKSEESDTDPGLESLLNNKQTESEGVLENK